jgi:hypothetical protein
MNKSSPSERLGNISSQMATTARFASIPMAPPDAILGIPLFEGANEGLTEDFKADKDSRVDPLSERE